MRVRLFALLACCLGCPVAGILAQAGPHPFSRLKLRTIGPANMSGRFTDVAAAAGSELNSGSSANDSVHTGPESRYRWPGETFCVMRYGG